MRWGKWEPDDGRGLNFVLFSKGSFIPFMGSKLLYYKKKRTSPIGISAWNA